MILRYRQLSLHPNLFLKLTGLRLCEFQSLLKEVQPLLQAQRLARLNRPERKRAIGGGDKASLDERDQILLAIVWLRIYPTNELLGYLFGVSDATVSRLIQRLIPLLAKSGNDKMKRADPGRKHRLALPELLKELPELALIVDSFEQKVQRPQTRSEADTYYSGKKKQHTLKNQITIEAKTGRVVHVSQSVVGPTADFNLLEQSGLLENLPAQIGVMGDLGYVGLATRLPGQGSTPRRKPRAKERPLEDVAYNTAYAKVRIEVEHTIGRVRTYQALAQTDRHHRKLHTERVQAVSGLVNHQIDNRLLKYRLAA
jgi:hypothetical protein